MKVFIHKSKDNECSNPNSFIALDGFRQMGWEITAFQNAQLLQELQPHNVVVGGITEVTHALAHFNIPLPAPLDYPIELRSWLGREIWESTMYAIAGNIPKNGVFVKPRHRSKSFTGKLIKEERDLIGCYDPNQDMEIWCAAPVNFVTEWRCYVRYGNILDVRKYKGDWQLHYDASVIEKAVQSYTSSPRAFALDFGITDKGETLLVEANDGYSLGAYGLPPLDYAKLLSARWSEITGAIDYCDF